MPNPNGPNFEAAFIATVRSLTFFVAGRALHSGSHPREAAGRRARKPVVTGSLASPEPTLAHPFLEGEPPSTRNASCRTYGPERQAPRSSHEFPLAWVPSHLPHPLRRSAPRSFAPTSSIALLRLGRPRRGSPEGAREERRCRHVVPAHAVHIFLFSKTSTHVSFRYRQTPRQNLFALR